MEAGSIEDVVAQQAETIRLMQEQLQEMAARVPPAAAPAIEAGKFYEFPRAVYRKHKKAKPGQIDHPGQDVKVVQGPEELKAAQRDGWSLDPHPFDYPDTEEEPTAAKVPVAAPKAARR